MESMKITKELKELIEKNQNQLKTGIRNHQRLLALLECDPDNIDIQKQLQTEQEHIIVTGLEQKVILDRLRKEYKVYRKQSKINGIKNSIEDKRFNLTNALNRARKQTIITRAPPSTTTNITPTILLPPPQPIPVRHTSRSPPSEDDYSTDAASISAALQQPPHATSTSPEPEVVRRPLLPQDVGQVDFLHYFHLATHDVFKEMQCRRVERKRRSTANPQFLYTRGWDISKRKRNFYLSNMTSSPPNTRQAVRTKVAKLDRTSPPSTGTGAPPSRSRVSSPSPPPVTAAPPSAFGAAAVNLPGITHLPSGLTIEPVREEQTICIDCKRPGNLSICEECAHGFHVACHNRPLVSTPRHCPVCYTDAKEARLRQQLSAAASSPITIVPPALMEEKLEEKNELLERNKELTVQLNDLQAQHSKLTISLREQETARENLLANEDCTKDKIQKILSFIANMKAPLPKIAEADIDASTAVEI